MIWLFHDFFSSAGKAGTYRRLTDDREFLKMSRRNSHVPIALVGKKKKGSGGGDTLLLSAPHT
jgi:hypothetical protein